jgi:hypothetical protein
MDAEGTFEQSVGIPPAQSEPAAQLAALTCSASCAQLTTRPETESTSCSAARTPAAAPSTPRTVPRWEGMVMWVRREARLMFCGVCGLVEDLCVQQCVV